MKTFFPNIAFLVSALEGDDAWDADQQTDAFDQVLDGLLWWRRWVKVGFGFPLIYAPSCPRIATVDGNDGVKAVLDPLFRPPMTMYLGHRHKQPYGLAWRGDSIYLTYNYRDEMSGILQELRSVSAHEFGHLIGMQNNNTGGGYSDVSHGVLTDIYNAPLKPNPVTLQQIRDAGIVDLKTG